MTKPLVGGKFKLFLDVIMNLINKRHRIGQQQCIVQNIEGLKVIESNESKSLTRSGNDPIMTRGKKYPREDRMKSK